MAWTCSLCGEDHSGIPLCFAADYPEPYNDLSPASRESRALISSDQCVIDEEQFFIRGLLEIPINGSDDRFLWGVWAGVSEKDFDLMSDTWELEGRERTVGPLRGRLANSIRQYSEDTLNLLLRIEIAPVGQRPQFLLENSRHSLSIAQRQGITPKESLELASAVLHDRLFI